MYSSKHHLKSLDKPELRVHRLQLQFRGLRPGNIAMAKVVAEGGCMH